MKFFDFILYGILSNTYFATLGFPIMNKIRKQSIVNNYYFMVVDLIFPFILLRYTLEVIVGMENVEYIFRTGWPIKQVGLFENRDTLKVLDTEAKKMETHFLFSVWMIDSLVGGNHGKPWVTTNWNEGSHSSTDWDGDGQQMPCGQKSRRMVMVNIHKIKIKSK